MNLHLRPKFLALLACLVAALALSACGDDDDSGDLGPDPATMAPADVPFYGEVVVRPEGDMQENFNEISKLSGMDDPGAAITSALDSELSQDGLSYSEDIEPWLGSRVGGFISSVDPSGEQAEGAAVVAVTDTDEAQSFIDKARESGDATLEEANYNGTDYLAGDGAAVGISGDFLILGTEQGLKDAIDAGAGDSLAENSDVSDSLDDAPDDSLFSAYVDTQSIIDLVESSGELPPAQLKQFEQQVAQYEEGPVNFWGTVGDDAISFAASAPAQTDAPEPSELVASFPSGSWLAFAAPDVGAQLNATLEQFQQGFQAGLEQADVQGLSTGEIPDPIAEIKAATGIDLKTDLATIGDIGGFVEGSSLLGLGGGIVMETSDEQGTAELVSRLQTALARQRELKITKTDAGFDVTISGAPVGGHVAVEDGKLVIAAGAATVDDVLEPDEALDESDRFNAAKDALGEDVTPSFYLDFLPILQLVEATGEATSDPDYQMAKPYLDALDFLAAGNRVDGDRTIASLVLGVREASDDDSDTAAAALTP
jgi:Protein of unknown function (DUF3352)